MYIMYIDIIPLQHTWRLIAHASPFFTNRLGLQKSEYLKDIPLKLNHKTLRCPVLPYLFILKKCCFWKKSSTMDANFLEASQHCQRGQQPFLCRPASDSCQCHRGWVTSKNPPMGDLFEDVGGTSIIQSPNLQSGSSR